jgi:hypothetical protein
MKKLYIHCGFHKTGTTSLQHALKDNAANLLKHNVLYPAVGVPAKLAGQHNLAWQLARYRRFDPALGDWNTLLSEIKHFDGTVVISSEDFEGTLLKPNDWKGLVSKLSKLGFQVIFVIYLRDPLTYLESIYLENLKSGSAEEYLTIFNSVCESKKLSYDDRFFHFDYTKIKKALATLTDAKTIFRDYHHLVGASVITDFEDLLNIHGVLSQKNTKVQQKNLRNSLRANLKLFVRNRNWSWFHQKSPQKIFRVLDLLLPHDNFSLITPVSMQTLFNARFSESNSFLENIYDTNAPEAAKGNEGSVYKKDTLAEPRLLNMQRVFSFETYVFLVNISRLLNDSELSDGLVHFRPYIQGQIAKWWRWVEISV